MTTTPSSSESSPLHFPVVVAAMISWLVLLTPVCSMGLKPEQQSLVACIVPIVILWMTQALPLSITSLLPLVLFPLSGVQSTKVTALSYVNSIYFLYFAGMVIAAALEQVGLHERLGGHCIRLMGTRRRQLLGGLMLATALISMWISNTASVLLMLPITLSISTTLKKAIHLPPEQQASESAGTMFLLGIAYAGSIGGIATLVGTPTNAAYAGYIQTNYEAQVSSGQWMLAFGPCSLILLVMAWFLLSRQLKNEELPEEAKKECNRHIQQMVSRPFTMAEYLVLIVFVLVGLLWLTRRTVSLEDFTLIPGWDVPFANFMNWLLGMSSFKATSFDDATVGLLGVFALTMIPVFNGKTRAPILTWEQIEKKVPWGILLLFGGGFAIAGAFKSTQLADVVGENIGSLTAYVPLGVIVLLDTLMLNLLTEMTSNVATVNTLLPVLDAIAVSQSINPQLLMVPAVVAASCAFSFPIATPPNTIVFSTGEVKVRDMIKYGMCLNLVSVFVVAFFGYVYSQLG